MNWTRPEHHKMWYLYCLDYTENSNVYYLFCHVHHMLSVLHVLILKWNMWITHIFRMKKNLYVLYTFIIYDRKDRLHIYNSIYHDHPLLLL